MSVEEATEIIQYEVDGPVATIWFNRPEVKNCINWEVLMGLGAAAGARGERRRRARRGDPRSWQHVLRRRRPEHARLRVPRHHQPVGQDRPDLGPHVRPRVQPLQADDRRRRGLRGGRRLRAVHLVRLRRRRGQRPHRRLPHPPRAVRRRRPDLSPAALHRPAQDQGAAAHRQAALRQGVRGVGPGQRLRSGRGARPGGGRLHRAADRQERVHDADHQARGQPRP